MSVVAFAHACSASHCFASHGHGRAFGGSVTAPSSSKRRETSRRLRWRGGPFSGASSVPLSVSASMLKRCEVVKRPNLPGRRSEATKRLDGAPDPFEFLYVLDFALWQVQGGDQAVCGWMGSRTLGGEIHANAPLFENTISRTGPGLQPGSQMLPCCSPKHGSFASIHHRLQFRLQGGDQTTASGWRAGPLRGAIHADAPQRRRGARLALQPAALGAAQAV